METTYKKGVLTIGLVKHSEKGNFLIVLYIIAKNLMWRGNGTDLVLLTLLQIGMPKLVVFQPGANAKVYTAIIYLEVKIMETICTNIPGKMSQNIRAKQIILGKKNNNKKYMKMVQNC